MPIYEYRCDACGNELEALQKVSDSPLEICPSCEAPKLKKMVSAPSFRLKGGGWYETDFKSGNKKNIAGDKPAATEKSKPSEAGESKAPPKTGKKAADSSTKSA